jgi:hypothetical protein
MAKCPYCQKTYSGLNVTRCPNCDAVLQSGAVKYPTASEEPETPGAPEIPVETPPPAAPAPPAPSAVPSETAAPAQNIPAGPLLRQALSETAGGEDFDEALLRVLKAQYPEHATTLFSAFTQLVDMEVRMKNLPRLEVIKQLAESDSSPQMKFSSTDKGPLHMTTTTSFNFKITKGNPAMEDFLPEIRNALEESRRTGTPITIRKVDTRTGCATFVLGGWLVALVKLLFKL